MSPASSWACRRSPAVAFSTDLAGGDVSAGLAGWALLPGTGVAGCVGCEGVGFATVSTFSTFFTFSAFATFSGCADAFT